MEDRGGDPIRSILWKLLSMLNFMFHEGHKSISNSISRESSDVSIILQEVYHDFRKQMSTVSITQVSPDAFKVYDDLMENLGDLVENRGENAIRSILFMLKLMSQFGHKYIQSELVEGLYNQSREQMSIEELEAEIFNYLVSGSMSQYHSDGMEISKMIHEIQQDLKHRLERHRKRRLHEKLKELAEERCGGNARRTAFASSLSGKYVRALNGQRSSSAMAHDMPLCPCHYGTSNEADVSNQDDFQSRVASSGVASSSGVCASVHGRRHTRDPGADATSEIGDHNFEMSDHGGDDPIEIRLEVSDNGDDDDPSETRHEESDHVGGHLNGIVAQVGGQAVVNLMASHSPDCPFLRLFAVFAGCSFVGSLYANSRLKNQKIAEFLTKFSAICLLFAVNIALGVNVLEGTKWHLNIVVTVALCVASVALVARADIGPPTTPASNQSRTSRQTSEASSSSQAPNFEAPVARPHTTGSC